MLSIARKFSIYLDLYNLIFSDPRRFKIYDSFAVPKNESFLNTEKIATIFSSQIIPFRLFQELDLFLKLKEIFAKIVLIH